MTTTRADTRSDTHAEARPDRRADLRRNLDTHRRWLERFFAEGALRDAGQIFDPAVEFQHRGGVELGQGLRGIKRMLKLYRAAAPDLRLAVKSQHPSGDVVTSCFIVSGTHTGPLFGMKPSGKRIWADGVDVATFSPEGKIVRLLFHIDALSFLLQVREAAFARFEEMAREGFPAVDPALGDDD